MRFEWDAEKARTNLSKHGVSFETATLVWDDPHQDVRLNGFVEGEERLQLVGVVGPTTTLLVIFSEREDRIRIITARKATARERRAYEEGA